MTLLPKGILNLGNTCFANSTLQALLSVKRYGNGLLQMQHNRTRCLQERSGKIYYIHILFVFFIELFMKIYTCTVSLSKAPFSIVIYKLVIF